MMISKNNGEVPYASRMGAVYENRGNCRMQGTLV